MERSYYAYSRMEWPPRNRHHLAHARERVIRSFESPFYRLHPEPYEERLRKVTDKLVKEKADVVLADATVIAYIAEWAQTVWQEGSHLFLVSLEPREKALEMKDTLILLLQARLSDPNGTKKRTFVIGEDQKTDTVTEPLVAVLRNSFPNEIEAFSMYV